MSPFCIIASVAVGLTGLFSQILWLQVNSKWVCGSPFLIIKPIATIITIEVKVLN